MSIQFTWKPLQDESPSLSHSLRGELNEQVEFLNSLEQTLQPVVEVVEEYNNQASNKSKISYVVGKIEPERIEINRINFNDLHTSQSHPELIEKLENITVVVEVLE